MERLNDEYFMKKAILQAKKALAKSEVPIGAVVVQDGKIIGSGYNKRNTDKDATAHAEVLAIKKACRRLGDWRVQGGTIYVTLEPCAMCAGAIVNARLSKVVFGAYDNSGNGHSMLFNKILTDNNLNHKTVSVGGVLEKECSELITSFFKKKRDKE